MKNDEKVIAAYLEKVRQGLMARDSPYKCHTVGSHKIEDGNLVFTVSTVEVPYLEVTVGDEPATYTQLYTEATYRIRLEE